MVVAACCFPDPFLPPSYALSSGSVIGLGWLPLRQEAAKRPAPLQHVRDLGRILARMVVGRS